MMKSTLNTLILTIFLCFLFLSASSQSTPPNGDLIFSISTNDVGFKLQRGMTGIFASQTPLPGAETAVSNCGVISLVHNIAITNTGFWTTYDTFKAKIFVKDFHTGMPLNVFTDTSPYLPYIECALNPMTHCNTPSTCGYSGNFFYLNSPQNGSSLWFGFYDDATDGFLTCASAGIWAVNSGGESFIYYHNGASGQYFGNVTSATPMAPNMFATTKYFYILAHSLRPKILIWFEIYGGVKSGSSPVTNWTLLINKHHSNPVEFARNIPVNYGTAASSLVTGVTPPNITAMQACTLPINRSTNELGHEDFNVSISPNPITDYLNISISNKKNNLVKISIYDLQGHIVFQDNYIGVYDLLEKTIPAVDFATGYYLVKVNNGIEVIVENFVKL